MSTSMALPLVRAVARAKVPQGSVTSTGARSRYFSISPRHHVRAVFGETSNETLRTTLNTIQEKITLPAHLPKAQRKILRDPKRKNYIEQNPVVIEIEGLEHKYTKIIFPNELPNSKKIFKDAIRAMETAEDWANLETLLAGYKKAGIVLKPKHLGFATRLAIAKTQLYSVIDCARHAKNTGYVLTVGESGLEVVMALADRAMTENHAQSIKWLEQLQDVLERSPHSDLTGPKDLRSSRLARGMMVSARVSDIEASETPSETQLNLLSDEVGFLRASWETAFEHASGPLQLEIDELNLNSLRPIANTSEDGTTKALSNPYDRIAPYFITKFIAHNIKACESAPVLLGQACEPLGDVGKKLDDYLTERITESSERSAGLRSRLPTLALAYQQILGRAPTWAQPAAEESKAEAA
ncbi:hypothetical protein NLU13_2893 [Sarocladium strictum]|uniref:Uncharacterized protein n=1 Tax=Sarocladium strictum TaxID=5046 RepID=A0AA39GKZ7_SARSR|nr:hypothetical protein NLU13_2893 [Sarocladium strictum]